MNFAIRLIIIVHLQHIDESYLGNRESGSPMKEKQQSVKRTTDCSPKAGGMHIKPKVN